MAWIEKPTILLWKKHRAHTGVALWSWVIRLKQFWLLTKICSRNFGVMFKSSTTCSKRLQHVPIQHVSGKRKVAWMCDKVWSNWNKLLKLQTNCRFYTNMKMAIVRRDKLQTHCLPGTNNPMVPMAAMKSCTYAFCPRQFTHPQKNLQPSPVLT